MVRGRSVPLIPSIVERVRSGPEQSRARRFLARRSVPLTARTDAKQLREEGKRPLPILLTHYRPRIPLLFDPNRCGGLPNGDKCRPIEWAHLLTILCQQVQLGVSKSRTCVLASTQSQVEAIHQRTRESVVGAP